MKPLTFFRNNVWTLMMVLFIVAFHILLEVADRTVEHHEGAPQTIDSKADIVKELKLKEKLMQERLMQKPVLSAILSLGLMFFLFGGLYTDIVLAIQRWRGSRWISDPTPVAEPHWGLRAVLQSFIFLYFIETLLFLVHILMIVFEWVQMPKDYYLLVHSLIRNFAVALFVLLIVRLRFGQGLRELGLTTEKMGVRIREGLRGYLAVIPPLIVLFMLLSWVMKLFAYEPEPQQVVQIFLKKTSESYLIAFTLFVAIVGPLLEEVYFRGFAFAALRKKWGIWPAALLTSGIFAAFHMNAVAFLPIWFLGLFLTYLYQATGSLVAPIAAHVVHNTLMVFFTLLFKSLTT